ncbi:hypothetical protein FPK45_25025, partial [Acinetobacter baumannii]|nr:hypothetical protein [Acinetobacter baumannii]
VHDGRGRRGAGLGPRRRGRGGRDDVAGDALPRGLRGGRPAAHPRRRGGRDRRAAGRGPRRRRAGAVGVRADGRPGHVD